jgi:hypothetical protein
VTLQAHPVTAERWPDFVDLFERRGPRGGHRNVPAHGCWCMFWRDRSLEHRTPKERAMGHLELFRSRGFDVVRMTSKCAVVRKSL